MDTAFLTLSLILLMEGTYSTCGRPGRFVAWRRGVFGWGSKCVCGERFDRGHTTCMPYPDPGLIAEPQFILDLDSELLDPGIKYLIVDFLLNQRLWNKARMILDLWALTMSNLLRANAPAQ